MVNPGACIALAYFSLEGGLKLLGANDFNIADRLTIGDMKVPTFYSTGIDNDMMDPLGFFIFFPVVGIIFGGIHCAGWFFDFPSSDEAMLWRMLLVLVLTILNLHVLVFLFLQSSY